MLAAYEEAKIECGVIDFEDVLLLMVGVLLDREDIADQVRGQYKHFVVDEYQDVSPLQQRLLDLWLGRRRQLCVVGDVSQTIYSFTGATPDYLTGFTGEFDGARTLRLTRDYRSTPQVMTAMQHLCYGSRRHPSVSGRFRTCQDQVRFFALHRINPHHPPLVRVPVNSFEF